MNRFFDTPKSFFSTFFFAFFLAFVFGFAFGFGSFCFTGFFGESSAFFAVSDAWGLDAPIHHRGLVETASTIVAA